MDPFILRSIGWCPWLCWEHLSYHTVRIKQQNRQAARSPSVLSFQFFSRRILFLLLFPPPSLWKEELCMKNNIQRSPIPTWGQSESLLQVSWAFLFFPNPTKSQNVWSSISDPLAHVCTHAAREGIRGQSQCCLGTVVFLTSVFAFSKGDDVLEQPPPFMATLTRAWG